MSSPYFTQYVREMSTQREQDVPSEEDSDVEVVPPAVIRPAAADNRRTSGERPTTPPKRARIDATVATPGEKKSLSPLSAAGEYIDRHTESLRDGIATLLRERGREHVRIFHRVHSKLNNVRRMKADDEYIPISARVKF